MEKNCIETQEHALWVSDWNLSAFTQTSAHETFLKAPLLPS